MRWRPGWPVAARAIAAAIVMLVAGLAAAFVYHDQRRAVIYRAAAGSPSAAARLIARDFGGGAAICHPAGDHDDHDNLISALFALERFARSPLESRVERYAVFASRWLGISPPDLSYGPGQIRLSRALALTPTPGQSPERHAAQRMAFMLLDACAARAIARRVIEDALESTDAGRPAAERLAHPQILRAAASYNAQADPDTAEVALAHHLYNETAYHLTLHYRYTGKAAETSTIESGEVRETVQ